MSPVSFSTEIGASQSGRALSPEATVLDNFCFSLHNMQFLEERPPELRQEIFELLFETANISKFAPEDKTKYEYDMTTERDIRNQIRYAEKHGREEQAIETARCMLSMGLRKDVIAQATGLTEEQIKSL
jgi:predicted transposase/invertase (TIGR01784 family)